MWCLILFKVVVSRPTQHFCSQQRLAQPCPIVPLLCHAVGARAGDASGRARQQRLPVSTAALRGSAEKGRVI